MNQQASNSPPGAAWAWSVGSGALTALLGVAALFLPVIDWAPKGGLVGWMLLLAGSAELALGRKRGADLAGRTAMVAGLLTALAGLVFTVDPLAGYFPVANVVMAWLLLRGAVVLAMAWKSGESRAAAWLGLGGAVDLLLGAVLVIGLPVASLVVSLFGPTQDIIARFSLILAVSFLVTGACQLAIGLAQRGRRQ